VGETYQCDFKAYPITAEASQQCSREVGCCLCYPSALQHRSRALEQLSFAPRAPSAASDSVYNFLELLPVTLTTYSQRRCVQRDCSVEQGALAALAKETLLGLIKCASSHTHCQWP
jgi:hypothetical protein